MTQAVENRIISLIKKYKATEEGGFRNEYRNAMVGTTPSIAELLTRVRDCLESWVQDSLPDVAGALATWQSIYDAAAVAGLPLSILEALLRRFPKVAADSPDWTTFVLACRRPQLVEALLARQLITSKYLNGIARAHPDRFVQSAALDVLASRKTLSEAAALWPVLQQQRSRPVGLLPWERALCACYASMPPKKGDPTMRDWLRSEPQSAEAIFDIVLGDMPLALRLCELLLSDIESERQRNRNGSSQDILIRWLLFCGKELQRPGNARAIGASVIVAKVRLYTVTTLGIAEALRGELGAVAAAATEAAFAQAFREGDPPEPHKQLCEIPVLLMFGPELHPAVQKCLRTLSNTNGTSGESQTYGRYVATKDVLKRVVEAMEEVEGGGQLRDALEVTVHNLGVRTLGKPGEHVHFDHRLHRSQSAGVFPGNEAIVLRCGRTLGEASDGIVLSKAIVRSA